MKIPARRLLCLSGMLMDHVGAMQVLLWSMESARRLTDKRLCSATPPEELDYAVSVRYCGKTTALRSDEHGTSIGHGKTDQWRRAYAILFCGIWKRVSQIPSFRTPRLTTCSRQGSICLAVQKYQSGAGYDTVHLVHLQIRLMY